MRGPAHAMLAVVTVIAGTPAVSAEPCAPRAQVDGDPAAVERVTAELELLGVQRGPAAPGCRGVVAQVELGSDGGIAVAIRDGARRSEGRVVSDAAMAASWIDSWLRDDLDGTSWLLATAAPAPAVVSAPPGLVPSRPPVDATPSRSRLELFSVSAAYEQTWLGDGASASGASAAACVRVGRTCIGGRARFSSEPDRVVRLTAMSRSDASVLATANVSLAVGRMTIAPELGLGFGWTTTRRIDECAKPVSCDPNNPMDPDCMQPPPPCLNADGTVVYVGDELHAVTFTPRLAAALRIAVPLFDHVWLDGLASFTLGPFGHTDPFTPGTVNTDPMTVPPEELTLPGESSTGIVLGVGLRVGAP